MSFIHDQTRLLYVSEGPPLTVFVMVVAVSFSTLLNISTEWAKSSLICSPALLSLTEFSSLLTISFSMWVPYQSCNVWLVCFGSCLELVRLWSAKLTSLAYTQVILSRQQRRELPDVTSQRTRQNKSITLSLWLDMYMQSFELSSIQDQSSMHRSKHKTQGQNLLLKNICCTAIRGPRDSYDRQGR